MKVCSNLFVHAFFGIVYADFHSKKIENAYHLQKCKISSTDISDMIINVKLIQADFDSPEDPIPGI
jgi:hypothetical protein